MKPSKNLAASVRQRLLNISREQKIEFQLILARFALERFLYRLSQSEYRDDFVLKGAMLFQVWGGSMHRPTRDLDLLSFGNPDINSFTQIIGNICGLNQPNDGLLFGTETLVLERIKEEDEYQGLRATLLATLDSARIPIQIDIGFGDAIVPTPSTIEYPTLLDLPKPKLRAYAKETVVAEKFHAMIIRGIANSRMKDFYDIWVLATTYRFEAAALNAAIKSTFERRDTPVPSEIPLAFTNEFADDTAKKAQWTAFIKRGNLLADERLGLLQIVPVLKNFVMPALTRNNIITWDPLLLTWQS